jgi:holin-like protein
MIRSLTVLVLCQLAGEVLARAAHLPIPGAVLGLLLLLAILIARGGPDREMKATAGSLLSNMTLLFVPAGVAIITELDALRRNWLPVTVALVVSTVLGMATTALVMQGLSRRARAPDAAE